MSDRYDIIRDMEGFSSEAYWDRTAWRVGYGSDTYVDANGNVKRVTETTTVSRDQAEADMVRRVAEFQEQGIKRYVDGAAWDSLSPDIQMVVTSVAYNYGSIADLKSLQGAINAKDPEAIANSIEKYATHNNGQNERRRKEEANMIRQAIRTGSVSSSTGNGVVKQFSEATPIISKAGATGQSATYVSNGNGNLTALLPEDVPDSIEGATDQNVMKEQYASQSGGGQNLLDVARQQAGTTLVSPLDEDMLMYKGNATSQNGALSAIAANMGGPATGSLAGIAGAAKGAISQQALLPMLAPPGMDMGWFGPKLPGTVMKPTQPGSLAALVMEPLPNGLTQSQQLAARANALFDDMTIQEMKDSVTTSTTKTGDKPTSSTKGGSGVKGGVAHAMEGNGPVQTSNSKPTGPKTLEQAYPSIANGILELVGLSTDPSKDWRKDVKEGEDWLREAMNPNGDEVRSDGKAASAPNPERQAAENYGSEPGDRKYNPDTNSWELK